MSAKSRRQTHGLAPMRWWLVVGFGAASLLALLSLDIWQCSSEQRGSLALVWASRALALVVFVGLLGHVRRGYDELQVEQRRRLCAAEARAERAARQRGEKLEAILAVARLVGQTPEPRRLLCSMLERACAAVQAGGGAMLLLSEDGRRMNQEAVVGEAAGAGDEEGTTRGIARWVIENGVSLRLGDAAADPRFGRMAGQQYRTVACVPLLVRGRAVGALQAVNKRDVECFTADDEALLCAFASVAALAIENAVLFEEAKDLTRRAVALASPDGLAPTRAGTQPARLRLV